MYDISMVNLALAYSKRYKYSKYLGYATMRYETKQEYEETFDIVLYFYYIVKTMMSVIAHEKIE